MKPETTIAALEREYAEIIERENSMGSYSEERVDRTLKRMREIAWRIAYLKASPERQTEIDKIPAELGVWP